jgi:hypothetical protein
MMMMMMMMTHALKATPLKKKVNVYNILVRQRPVTITRKYFIGNKE